MATLSPARSLQRLLTVAGCSLFLLLTLYLFAGHDVSRPLTRGGPEIVRRQPFCPSAHGPDPPLEHAAQVCSPVPSAHPDFDLELCHDPLVCNSFTFRIARNSGDVCRRLESEKRKTSEDAELDRWMRDERGPDTFSVRTDGAERTGHMLSTYEGGCQYRFDVSLRNAGPVWLTAWHDYENYTVLDEIDPEWPKLYRTPLFTDPIGLNICSRQCTPAVPRKLLLNESTTVYPPNSPTYLHDAEQFALLPACSGDGPVPGSYLPMHPLDVYYPPVKLPHSYVDGTPVAGRYQFVPHGCRWKHNGLRFADPVGCTAKPTRILVIGDSHGRVIVDGLYHRLRGQEDIVTVSEKTGDKVRQVGNLDIQFLWDPTGENTDRIRCSPDGLDLADFDVLILSIASHYGSTRSTAEYISQATRFMELFSSCPNSPQRKIYLPPAAQPPRQDNWPAEFHDRRTNVRLGHWNNLIHPIVLSHGWNVIDHFALTMPHMWEVIELDSSHYLGTDAIDPVLDEVIAKAGICDA